jgi:flagellar FliL protein
VKAESKGKGKAEAVVEAPVAKSSKKKILVLVLVALIAAAAASGLAWFFTQSSTGHAAPEHKEAPAMPAIFVPIDPFTVNLQSDSDQQFLAVTIQLQVANLETSESIKTNLPLVRNRILILLSSKKAAEITSVEGKQKLSQEIVALMKQPFTPKGKPQEVGGALFTAFIIQ